MTGDLGNIGAGAQRTRRNIMKMGAILGPIVVMKAQSASAGPLCKTFLGPLLPWCDPPGHGGNPPSNGGAPNCLLKGTKVLTAEGERKVEELAAGDLLPTRFGGLRPIQWIARYPLRKSDPSKPWVEDVLPVRISRSALAPNVPHADLYVTGGHNLLIDGVLAPAEMLINGTTITRHQERECDELEFFHIKLESHDAIYAEGVPVETIFEVDESAPNFVEYFRLYGMPTTEGTRCAPTVHIYWGRDELKSRFRSALSPWVDLRTPADVIRDRMEERGVLLSRQAERV
jgi:Hint domain